MDDKITIIEGPPPVFEHVNDGWAMGLNESPTLSVPALTRLRTFNGPALVQRCYTAWHQKSSIHLHYRNDMGLEQTTPIRAARNVEPPKATFCFSGFTSMAMEWNTKWTPATTTRWTISPTSRS